MIDFLMRPLRRNFGKDKNFYAAIDDMFGFIPHNIELYKLALIHKSASVVLEDGRHINNERLEFLGDAVLECVSSDFLFIEFPDMNEGFLTQLRSKMVSRQTLNEVAKRIGLDEYVITHSSNNLSQKHIYGDAFEAMMGAIYLDQGYDFVNRLLINRIFVDYIKVANLLESETDFKSRLIEWCQKNHHTIHFATTHDKTYSSSHPFFYSKVLIDNIEVGYGAGDSKKEAEQRAAHSVSQGFSDEECSKLLDKLDNLDASRSSKKRIVTEDEVAEPIKKSQKSSKSPKTKRGANTASTQGDEVKSKKEEISATENKEQAVSASTDVAERKPTRSPRRKRTVKSQEQRAEESAVIEHSPQVSDNATKQSAASASQTAEADTPKKRPQRRVSTKRASTKKSQNENAAKESVADVAEGEKSAANTQS